MQNVNALKKFAANLLGVSVNDIPADSNAGVLEYLADHYAAGGGGAKAETDPTVPDWAKQPTKPAYTAAEVGAMPDSTAIPTGAQLLQGGKANSIQTLTDDADDAAIIGAINSIIAALAARGITK